MAKLKHAGEFTMLECVDFDPKCSKNRLVRWPRAPSRFAEELSYSAHPCFSLQFTTFHWQTNVLQWCKAKIARTNHI